MRTPRSLNANISHLKLRVVYAQRRGNWFDKKSAKLTLYELEENAACTPGTPDLYFKPVKTTNTKSRYCDMDEALDHEVSFYNGQ